MHEGATTEKEYKEPGPAAGGFSNSTLAAEKTDYKIKTDEWWVDSSSKKKKAAKEEKTEDSEKPKE